MHIIDVIASPLYQDELVVEQIKEELEKRVL
jgi:hypothetical protein